MAVALGSLTVVGALFIAAGSLALLGKLPRYRWAAGAPLLIFGGVAITSAGLAFLPFSIAGKVSDRLAGIVSAILAVVAFATVSAAWFHGTRVVRSRTAAQ